MAIPFPETVTRDSLFIWIMHRIQEVFRDHAILKGGMCLRLLHSPRSTNDLDYVFVPYTSKKDILGGLKDIVEQIPDAETDIALHSNSIRINIFHKDVSTQIEASIDTACKSQPVSTSFYAEMVHEPGRVIRIMDFSVALAHKLAAWNERRLFRDLYDVYFLFKMVGTLPDNKVLVQRLAHINSRLPRLKKVKAMQLSDFIDELKQESHRLTQKNLENELSPLMEKKDLAGLEIQIKTALNELLVKLDTWR
jgi:predicted nucleotidyltransferase component of viral defense system